MQYASGSATAGLCYQYWDEVNDVFYATIRTVFSFTDPTGSYYEEYTQPGGVIVNDESCGDLEYDTSYDPEASYGTPAGTEDEYLNEVSPPTTAAALAAIIWADPETPSALQLSAADWHGQPIDIFLATTSSASFASASAESDRVRFRVVRGYHALVIALHWADDASGSGILSIPTNGDWSAWLSAADGAEITTALLKVGKYA